MDLNIKVSEQCVKALGAFEKQVGFRLLARSAGCTQCQDCFGLRDNAIVVFGKALESLRSQWFGKRCHRTLDRCFVGLG